MRLSDVPVRDPQVISQNVDGETLLVHPAQGTVRVLNPVGARLWELADGSREVTEMAGELVARYKVSLDQAQRDALAFFEDLTRRGVIGWVRQP